MTNNTKQILWYIAGHLAFVLFTCFLMMSQSDMAILYIRYFLLSIGFIIGFLLKEKCKKQPHLLFFLPIFYLIIMMLIGL